MPESPNSISIRQDQILTDALYQLTTEWPVDQEKVFGKREQLRLFLREVGEERFKRAIQRTIENYARDYFPPVGYIRTQVDGQLSSGELNDRRGREEKRREVREFDGLVLEIDQLERNAASYPGRGKYFLFQRSRSIGIFHWWLRQHPDAAGRLPPHLTWVTDYDRMNDYVIGNPPPGPPNPEIRRMVDGAWAKWRREHHALRDEEKAS